VVAMDAAVIRTVRFTWVILFSVRGVIGPCAAPLDDLRAQQQRRWTGRSP